jgi:hypothetical protein
MRLASLFFAAGLIALTGCAAQLSARHAVEKGMILPEGAQQTELKANQKFLMAAPIENRMPAFPKAPVQQAETTICVEFIVSEDGRAGSVHQIDTAPGCEKIENSASRIFFPAVRTAVESWTYFGSALCDYEVSEGECEQGTAKLTPLAIKLAYKFSFTQSNGKRGVSSGLIK